MLSRSRARGEKFSARPFIVAAVTRSRLLPFALGLVLALAPGVTLGKGKSLDPEEAEAKRAELLAAQPDEPRAAIDRLVDAGEELGDPELLLLAAQQASAEADRARDDALAREAATLALIARDISLHLADERNFSVTSWRPVTRERAASLAVQAETLAGEAEQLAETIVAERAAAEEEARRAAAAGAEDDKPKRERKPGTGLIAGGAAMLAVGAGGIGMIGAGVALGQSAQRDAEALVLPQEIGQLDAIDARGARANAISFVGVGVATVGVAVGTALIIIGVNKRKAGSAPGSTARVQNLHVGGWLDRQSAGAAVGGRF